LIFGTLVYLQIIDKLDVINILVNFLLLFFNDIINRRINLNVGYALILV